jgi:hypothetical protein
MVLEERAYGFGVPSEKEIRVPLLQINNNIFELCLFPDLVSV